MKRTEPTHYYQECLKNELAKRIEKNSRYSLRSFASAIKISSSALSQIISGKRSVSTRVVERLINHLELTPQEAHDFLASVIQQKNESGLSRISPQLKKKLNQANLITRSTTPGRGVGLDEFRVISDWYHYAILELTFSKNFKSDPRWIAQELDITVIEAKLAIDRLLQLELLEIKEGQLHKTTLNIDTKDKTKTSNFLKKRQKQLLEKSLHALENVPIQDRNHSGLTLCIDPAMIPEAKDRIQKFLWELAEHLVSGEPQKVYEVGVHLFPLHKSSPNQTQNQTKSK